MAKKQILVYGSLRKGCYNFDAFKSRYGDDIEYVKTIKIEGFDLFSLGAYPAINHGEGTLTCDVLAVTEEVFTRINYMELGAGYRTALVEIDDQSYPIYVYNRSLDRGQVMSGDWVKYLENGRKENPKLEEALQE